MNGLSAAEIIRLLRLEPHPEGGHFRETFRDSEPAGSRPWSTAILYLLAEGQESAWHRVRDAAELWHYYAGAPLHLRILQEDAGEEILRLGIDLMHGEVPQALVPRDRWQSARSMGAWTLVGCTVAPGFTFDAFEMRPKD